MLFKQVEKVCKAIDALDPERDGPEMYRQIERARPDVRKLKDIPVVGKIIFDSLGPREVKRVRESSAIARRMVQVVRKQEVGLGTQLAILSVLIYFVKSDDLVPDNLGGGYGFVDDTVVLRAGLFDLLDELPESATKAEEEGDFILSVRSLLPEEILPKLEEVVSGVRNSVQIFKVMPSFLLAPMREQLITNPALASIPTTAPGFVPSHRGFSSIPSLHGPFGGGAPKGHWSGGMYFEGNDVVMPGGPSLIGGKLFIPDT
jgi:uncharacterized membrane protein YkvA (DUF1232 family)